jgi:hypothetical protein
MMTTAAKKIEVDHCQWLILKRAKTTSNSTPMNPKAYFSFSLMEFVNFRLKKYRNRLGRKRKIKMAAVSKTVIPPKALLDIIRNKLVVRPMRAR